jgi:hypothetical protein
MYVPEKHYYDFGPKNIALIAVVAVVLGSLAWSQRPIRIAAVQNRDTLSASLIADNSSTPKVLGATEYNQELINQFEPIQIQTSDDNSQQGFIRYAQQVNIVKSADRVETLLNGTVLERNKTDNEKFIADLKKIAAPSELSDYHKLLLAYYQLLFTQQDSLQSDRSRCILARFRISLPNCARII